MDSDLTSDEQPAPPADETQPPAGETPPEAAPEAPPEAAAAESSDPLTQLADRALKGRLSAPDEEQATQLIAAALLEGRDGVARVVEQLPKLPWIVGVTGVINAWPEMKPTMRNRLIAGLARVDSEPARRVRLSLARGLFKLEPAFAAKLAVTVAKEIRDKETGALTPRNAQIFANVLIGRAKPWIAQLPLADLKAVESDQLVHCALLAVFLVPHAPVTQLGVIKWASDAGKLAKLPPVVQEAVVKGLNRWSGKWQGVLRREVEGLPEEILSTLKAEQPAAPAEREPRGRGGAPREEREPREPREEPEDREEREDRGEPGEPRGEREEDDEDEDERDEDERDADADEQSAAPRKPRPVYESKTVPPREREQGRERERDRRGGGNFNLTETLRQIEAHVASLRSELSTAQSKLRQREEKPRRPERMAPTVIPGEPSADELARLNIQLEARNAELQQRIEDLTADSEDRAASTGLAAGTPVEDCSLQLRNLLILKLKDDYDDYLALENESRDLVAPKHYRVVLAHVFEVLAAEGIFGK
ncbi:MAG TPA: hypothetical protein VGO11_04810 [Chthoniobacteraceae bacterium]|jgi:hypothetical protein|nr:hypothetical protein [Chthoniobacteraceae bacterium]